MDALEKTLAGQDRLRSFSDLTFARSGGAIAATVRPASREARQAYQSRIWLFPLDGAATQLTHGPNSDAMPRFSPVDDRLAFASDRSILGKISPYLLDRGEVRPIGDLPGSVEDQQWTKDGAHLLVLSADRGLDHAATSGATRLWWAEEADPEVTNPAMARRRLFRVTVASGATEEAGPPDLTIWEFVALDDGGAIALVSADASERGWYQARLARLEFARRSAEILYESRWQLQGPAVDPTGQRIAFLEGWSSDRGLVAGEIRLLDLASRRVTSIAADALSNVSSIDWRDADHLWFAGWSRMGSMYGVVDRNGTVEWTEREDATLGPTSFLAQISPTPDKTGFAAIRETVGVPSEITYRRSREAPWQALTDFNQEVAAEFGSYPEVRPVAWTGADGLAIEGMLLLPRERGAAPLPMVVDVHGGPTWSVKHAFNPGFALPLAAAGYAVFLPNYRGNVGWGQAYVKLNVGDPGGAEFEDILRGIDWCVAAGFARPDYLGITGASYGGYLTAWAVATTRRFKAAVMVSGIANQWSCHYSCNHAFGEFIVGGAMDQEAPRRLAIERSPLMRLAGATTPTLILHGREDRCTPLGQAQELYSALVEQGAAAELVVYPREGHGLQERAHRRDAWRRTVGWFNRYLRPDE